MESTQKELRRYHDTQNRRRYLHERGGWGYDASYASGDGLMPFKRIMAGRTKRLRLKIVRFLEKKGPQNSQQIYDYLNKSSYSGATQQQVGNILSKDPRFRPVSRTQVLSPAQNQRYDIQIWDLSLDYKEWE